MLITVSHKLTIKKYSCLWGFGHVAGGVSLGMTVVPTCRLTPTQKAVTSLARKGQVRHLHGRPGAQVRTGSSTTRHRLLLLLPAVREAQEKRGMCLGTRNYYSCDLSFPMASFGPKPKFHSTHTVLHLHTLLCLRQLGCLLHAHSLLREEIRLGELRYDM